MTRVRGIFRTGARPPLQPTPVDATAFNRSIHFLALHLSRLEECLTWWARQARNLSERIAAQGTLTWSTSDQDWRGYHEALVGLLALAARLSKMAAECRGEQDRIDEARARFQRRTPHVHVHRILRSLVTEMKCEHLIDHHAIDVGIEQVQLLLPVLQGAVTNWVTDSIGDEPLAVDRDLHGLLRMPAHIEALERGIQDALTEARATAMPRAAAGTRTARLKR